MFPTRGFVMCSGRGVHTSPCRGLLVDGDRGLHTTSGWGLNPADPVRGVHSQVGAGGRIGPLTLTCGVSSPSGGGGDGGC